MDIRTIFLTLFVIWKFNKYIPSEYFLVLFQKINIFYYKLRNSSVNAPDLLQLNDDTKTNTIIQPKPQVKYEDKYYTPM